MSKLPVIPNTEGEKAVERHLLEIMQALGSKAQWSEGVALVGGTSLRLLYGLTRPSTDIDLEKLDGSRLIGLQEMPKILRKAGFRCGSPWRSGTVEIRTHMKYAEPGPWAWAWKPYMLTVDEINDQRSEVRQRERRFAIPTYTLKDLCATKLRALVGDEDGEGRRREIKGRDLYDGTFIRERWEELIDDRQREEMNILAHALKNNETVRKRWGDVLQNDAIMGRVDAKDVIEAFISGHNVGLGNISGRDLMRNSVGQTLGVNSTEGENP